MKRDLIIGISLLATTFAIRLIFAARLVFPPLDDPAFYLQTARNLAAGRGLVSDVIWNYFVPFSAVTHPSHEYWMPLATWLMSPFIKVFGDTLLAAQLPGIICGAALAPLTYALGRTTWPNERERKWAMLAAVLLGVGAVPVYQAASTDGAAPFALCASAALLTGGLALERRSNRWAMLAGVFSGLAYLARSDGLLIPALIGLALVWAAARRHVSWTVVVAFGAAASLPIGAWGLRNLSVFGVAQPVSPLWLISLQNYGQLFNSQSVPAIEQLLARGGLFLLDLRVQALGHNLSTWAVIAFPFGIVGLPGLLLARRPALRLGWLYGLMLVVSTALMFSVPTLMGLFYHSAAATLPWLAVGCVSVVRRIAQQRSRLAFALYAVVIGLMISQAAMAWPSVWADSRANEMRFAAAVQWLKANVPPGQPIITNEAHSLNYASGYPAMTLPNQEDAAVVAQLADRYGARFVVVLGSIGLYPQALDQATHAIKRWVEGDIVIYELR